MEGGAPQVARAPFPGAVPRRSVQDDVRMELPATATEPNGSSSAQVSTWVSITLVNRHKSPQGGWLRQGRFYPAFLGCTPRLTISAYLNSGVMVGVWHSVHIFALTIL